MCILKLVERKLLHLNDTLGALAPFELGCIDGKVTVEQLLTHTSGVPDYFDESVMDEYEELWRDFPNYRIRHNSDILPFFVNKPMMYPAGERFQYNNSGYVVLAAIIEKLTGLPFDEYIRNEIFLPCGMEDSGYFELDRLPANCANSYLEDEDTGELRTNIYSVDVKGTGAGGAFLTLGDVERFWTALLGFRLLSRETTEAMLSAHSGSAEEPFYGYGIWLKPTENGRLVPYFQGCDPGVSFISAHYPLTQTNISLVSNYCDDVWALSRGLAEHFEA